MFDRLKRKGGSPELKRWCNEQKMVEKFIPNLALSIIENAAIYLTKIGSIQIPLISLSNVQKIVNVAEENFSDVKIIKSKDWFLPKEMESLKDKMNELKSKNYINFDEKFGKIICKTSIAVCKNQKI